MQAKWRCFPLVVALILFALPAWAQQGGRVTMAADVGALWPYMTHPKARHFDEEVDFVFGGHIDYGISDHAGIQFGMLRSDQEVETGARDANTMTMQELYASFRWNFLLGIAQPYILLGPSYHIINLDPPLEDESVPGGMVGLGVNAILTDNISLGLNSRFTYIFTREFDSARLITCLATVGFSF